MHRRLWLAPLILSALFSASAYAQAPTRLAAGRVAGAREPERVLNFGRASLAVQLASKESLQLRARDASRKVDLRVDRAAVSAWVAKADVMILLVGKTDPLEPLRGSQGAVGLKPLTAWGEPRYELSVSDRERNVKVTAELSFDQANQLLGTLRALAPEAEPPRPMGAVDRPVAPKSSNRPPQYPRNLRDLGVGGEVVLRVVVDTNGRVERESIEVVRSSDDRLVRAVRDAVDSWRFVPAEAGGKKVRQLVELPFVFARDDMRD